MGTTNEPVAWMWRMKDSDNRWELIFNKPINDDQFFETVPLYTRPTEHELGIAEAIGFDKGYKAATPKELTNDEIMAVAMETSISYKNWGYYSIDFARAILKKASEK